MVQQPFFNRPTLVRRRNCKATRVGYLRPLYLRGVQPTSHPVILFDGVCNFCNGSVNFLIQADKKKRFRFAPLQSAAGQQLLQQFGLQTANFNSFVLIENDTFFQNSSAALRVLNGLPWYWRWTQVFWLLPLFLRDALYQLIARNRYRWFGKREACMIPTPAVRERFLP